MTDAKTPTKSSSRLLLIILSVLAAGALGFLVAVWIVVNPTTDTLWFEVAKTSLQVFGVAVIGGIVGIATFRFQQDRQNADKEADRALELQREEFERRAALLDRTSRCAQKMYVTCQHVRRIQRDHLPKDGQLPQLPAEARSLLDEAYLEFNAEAEALEVELGARYGIRKTIEEIDVSGQAYLLWHQISDLLTVYYFGLCGNFRYDILKANSKRDGMLHTGLELERMVNNHQKPTAHEVKAIIDKIRPLFNDTMPALASAILKEKFTVALNDAEMSRSGG